MQALVREGAAIALLPAMATRAITDRDLIYVPLTGAIRRHVHRVTKKGRSLSPAAQRLRLLVLEALAKLEDDGMITIGEGPRSR